MSTHAPAGPPPGLYDHPLSEAEHQALASQLASLHQLEPLDPAEAPQRLARYLRQLSEIALAALPEAQRVSPCSPCRGSPPRCCYRHAHPLRLQQNQSQLISHGLLVG